MVSRTDWTTEKSGNFQWAGSSRCIFDRTILVREELHTRLIQKVVLFLFCNNQFFLQILGHFWGPNTSLNAIIIVTDKLGSL